MFATSTKTATFLPTLTPMQIRARASEPGPGRYWRRAHELPSRFGDEHARVRQVDALTKQVGGIERAAARPQDRRLAEAGQAVDIGDAGWADQVLHAESTPRAAVRPDGAVSAVPIGDREGGPAPGR